MYFYWIGCAFLTGVIITYSCIKKIRFLLNFFWINNFTIFFYLFLACRRTENEESESDIFQVSWQFICSASYSSCCFENRKNSAIKRIIYQVISLKFNLDFLKRKRKNTFYLSFKFFFFTSFTIFFTKESIYKFQLIWNDGKNFPSLLIFKKAFNLTPHFAKNNLLLIEKHSKFLQKFF